MREYNKPIIKEFDQIIYEGIYAANSGNGCPKGRNKRNNGCLHNMEGENGRCPNYDQCPFK